MRRRSPRKPYTDTLQEEADGNHSDSPGGSGRDCWFGARSTAIVHVVTAEALWHELGRPQIPATIWQAPFDYDPEHLHSLCRCQAEGRTPGPDDLMNYAEDLSFEEEVQPDLFVFLLPVCLKAWSTHLLGQGAAYLGFVEQYWCALNKRPGALGLLSEKQRSAVERYFQEAILMAIDGSRNLRSNASKSACYRWFDDLGSFATIFPGLGYIWLSWWNLDSEGRAIGALQYLSCLMYETGSNPAFAAWTPTRGGGPPTLWSDSMAVNDQPWDAHNVSFLRSVLVPSQLFSAINRCLERLANPEDEQIALKMRNDFECQLPLLELRIEQLLGILSSDRSHLVEWPI